MIINNGIIASKKKIILRKWNLRCVLQTKIFNDLLFYGINIGTVSLPGISLDEANKIGAIVDNSLLSIPEMKSVTRRQGRAELDEHALGVNGAEIEATFVLGKRPREEFMFEVRKKMAGISGVNITSTSFPKYSLKKA